MARRSNFIPTETRMCPFGILDHMDKVCLCGSLDANLAVASVTHGMVADVLAAADDRAEQDADANRFENRYGGDL